MKVFNDVTELIGKTPLVRLSKKDEKIGLYADILGKMESFNPGGSVKDRIAEAMIKKAINDGKINRNTVIAYYRW